MTVLDTDRISTFADADALNELQFVAFDVETTGLSPVVARLVELSGVKFSLGSGESDTFSTLIDPEMEIPAEVSQIHGITDEMVSGAPKCSQVVPEFLDWIGGERTVLVAHNAPFDVEFMQVAIDRCQKARPANFVLDTLPFSRAVLPQSPDHKLKTLVEYLELAAGEYHRALADSHHVRHVLHKLLEQTTVSSWKELVDYGCVFRFDRNLYNVEPPAEIAAFITELNEAIRSGSSVSFVYSGYRTFRRTVDPVAVIQSRGTYYLSAYCRKALAERTFRVDKMSQVKSVELKRAPRRKEAAS